MFVVCLLIIVHIVLPRVVYYKIVLFRVMITKAYTTIENTMRYYGNKTNLGAHMPLNFGLIDRLNIFSNAAEFNDVVYCWLDHMPKGKSANWMVTVVTRLILFFFFNFQISKYNSIVALSMLLFNMFKLDVC